MAANDRLAVFENDEIVMPTGVSDKDTFVNQGISQDKFEEAIKEDVVEGTVVKEEESLEQPNYLIDLSLVLSISKSQTEGLRALTRESGPIALYIAKGDNVSKIGYTTYDIAARVLRLGIKGMFGAEATLYKDVKIGEQPMPLRTDDVTSVRLNL